MLNLLNLFVQKFVFWIVASPFFLFAFSTYHENSQRLLQNSFFLIKNPATKLWKKKTFWRFKFFVEKKKILLMQKLFFSFDFVCSYKFFENSQIQRLPATKVYNYTKTLLVLCSAFFWSFEQKKRFFTEMKSIHS